MYRIIIIVVMLCIAILLSVAGCGPEAASDQRPRYNTYKDIPGITAQEIEAISALQQGRKRFVYGINITMEGFVSGERVDGFARLFCERLSELIGIRFEPKVYTWDELKDKLASGEIDFTGELTPNPERLKQYFMTDPIAQRIGKIFVNRNGERLSVIAKERPIRCAFLEGSTLYPLVAASWNLPFEALFVDDAELPGLFEKGLVDAFIDENTMEAILGDLDYIKAEDYFPLIFSPVSLTTENADLAPIISVIQKYLGNGGFFELSQLYKQGIAIYYRHKLFNFLTDEEKEYISRHNSPQNPVALAMESDNYPLAFYNRTDKEFQGIALDVLNQVRSLTGLTFHVADTPEQTWASIMDDLEGGRIAIISELVRSKMREGRFLWTDEPYCYDNHALISRADYPDVEINQILYSKVGLVAESVNAEIFNEWFPESNNTVVYDSHYLAFEALERREVDLVMASQNLLLSLTNYLEKPGFKANIVFNYPYESLFGFNKDEKVLQSVVSKAQNYIDVGLISERWQSRVFDYNSKLLRDVMPYLLLAIALLVLGFTAAFILLMKNRRMSHNLENIVAQRTGELEHASRAKSDFLSRMSHEMRTPMNAIIGMAKIAENTEDLDKLKYCLATIGTSSTHLLELINDVLDMSKIEAGKFELDSTLFNMEVMLKKICDLIIDRAEEKQQTLNVVMDTGMHLHYYGDELRLSQVLSNLLSNAVKFTPRGGGGKIVLSVSENIARENVARLRFSVSDTGIGMSKEQVARLFNAFEQADNSISKRFGGTGLGLAISKSIVEKMNGCIWVKSETGRGSDFIFEVELEIPEQDELAASKAPADMRVLVAESDARAREHMCAIIEQFGINCREAADSDEAVQMLSRAAEQERPFDVIFVDNRLDADLDLVRQLEGRVDPATIVVMSSFLEKNQLKPLAAQAGINHIITKPLFPSTVFNAIAEVGGKVVNKSDLISDESNEQYDFSSLRLLLVEDMHINRVIFTSLLKDTGINIDIAENGVQAVEMFNERPDRYDIIVMDLQMPEMDGYEATRQIRASVNVRGATIPIIAMTANAFKEDIEKCLAWGMNDHTAKPIDEKEVVRKIAVLTGKQKD